MVPAILLADDHPMMTRSLKGLFKTDFGYRDVESATTCAAVLKSLHKRKFTHLVIDIGLADGSALEILPVIKSLHPDLKILVHSAKPPEIYERVLQNMGVDHYLSKEENEMESIRRFRLFLGDDEPSRPKTLTNDSPFASLTDRQLQVMHYFLDGKPGAEIARTLNIKRSTVSTLKSQLLERTGTTNLIELAALAELYRVK